MRPRIIKIIAFQQWKISFRNKAVPVLTLVIGLMLIMAAFSGWKIYKDQTTIRTKYSQQVREQWLNNPDKHPHRMAHYGYLVFRSKHPLSFFDFGMESFTGTSVFLEAHRQNSVNFSEAGFSTGILRFGELHIAMILQLLLPLLIFFLGFNAISAEREGNTLKVLLCQGISWPELLMGKTLGITAVTLVLYLPVILATILLWLLLSGFNISADDAIRLILLLITYLLYFMICALAAVMVSALSRTSKASLIALTGIWITLMIVLPRAVQALGAHQYPTPSRLAFETAVEEDLVKAGDSHNPNDPHYAAIKDSLLRTYKVDSVQQLPFNYGGFIMAEGERISADIYKKHQYDLIRTYESQNNFARYAAFADPYIAVKNFSMALAGTGFASYTDFQDQVEDFRYKLAQRMNRLQMDLISNDKHGSQHISHEHWAEMPDFRYTFRKTGAIFRHEALSIAAMLCWTAVLLILLFTITKKFRAL
ncbi:ABC transporter permease [Chitinophaga tropicalis]|uniref:DUF3526 domain-containing protein n=1 Tax=Chitinophaga tropicalis TaxID=2683588 RepID=A0A7K1U6K0_9BACT|nr:DUF3526 domain-containing protein [Chitinophaga tropicalis]MVT09984.1 DUF3526 domain-containing protein [Chitinophaga tropicalis]